MPEATMPRRDHAEDSDFHTQGFERPGVVSIWLGMSPVSDDPAADVLQDHCGVGYYSLDDQEANSSRPVLTDVGRLLDGISYAASFRVDAIGRAEALKLGQAQWVIVQFDFAYRPESVRRPIADDPRFIGVFSYRRD